MSHLIFVCSDSFGLFSYRTKWILSVQTIFALSVCSFKFGMFHYSTECDLCSDRQFNGGQLI